MLLDGPPSWRTIREADARTRLLLIGLGACLAVMNAAFYLVLDRLPMSLVAALEFVGTIGIALYELRTGRNLVALKLLPTTATIIGVIVLAQIPGVKGVIGVLLVRLGVAVQKPAVPATPEG